jgi:hypothetical protein
MMDILAIDPLTQTVMMRSESGFMQVEILSMFRKQKTNTLTVNIIASSRGMRVMPFMVSILFKGSWVADSLIISQL